MQFLLVFVGAGFGACTRHLINIFVTDIVKTQVFFATILSNILGCLILGALTYIFLRNTNISYIYKLLLVTGFCGGLTTFSAFVFDFIKLFQSGAWIMGLIYLFASIVLSILTFIFGFYLLKIVS